MSSGLLASVQNLLASLLGLARTRLDLLSTELEEAMAHFALGIIVAVAAVLLATLGLAFAGAALLFAIPVEHRLAAAIAIALLYIGVAAGLVVVLVVRKRPRIFEASLAELQSDREELSP